MKNNNINKINENSFGVLVFYLYICINIKNNYMVNKVLVDKMDYISQVLTEKGITYKFDAEHYAVMIKIDDIFNLLNDYILIHNDLWNESVDEFNIAQYNEAKTVVDNLIK